MLVVGARKDAWICLGPNMRIRLADSHNRTQAPLVIDVSQHVHVHRERIRPAAGEQRVPRREASEGDRQGPPGAAGRS